MPGATCANATTASTASSTYDSADLITNTGYGYDALGRTTTVPAATTGTTSTQTVNDYADDSDSPAWSTTGSDWTRDVTGPDGSLDATVSQTGTVTLDLTNLDDSQVATAADSSTDTGIDADSYASYGPFGTPTNTTAAESTGYGWEGAVQRSADSLGGLILMGARLYNPTTGRFLSVDSVYGGNANPYVYPTNPIDNTDLTGNLSSALRADFRVFADRLQPLQLIADLLALFFEPAEGWAFMVTTVVVAATCLGYGLSSGRCRGAFILGALGSIGVLLRGASRGIATIRSSWIARFNPRVREWISQLGGGIAYLYDVYEWAKRYA